MATRAMGERSGDCSLICSSDNSLDAECCASSPRANRSAFETAVSFFCFFFFCCCLILLFTALSLAAQRLSFAPLFTVSMQASKPGAARPSDVIPTNMPSILVLRKGDDDTARASCSAVFISLLCCTHCSCSLSSFVCFLWECSCSCSGVDWFSGDSFIGAFSFSLSPSKASYDGLEDRSGRQGSSSKESLLSEADILSTTT
mmetsp:Transcript_15728/g.34308  ORF Transcript_15728/g.34308 Transcript_15728/m.34308 type:complete len:202 (-) Transcript_15728:680-1285(-)